MARCAISNCAPGGSKLKTFSFLGFVVFVLYNLEYFTSTKKAPFQRYAHPYEPSIKGLAFKYHSRTARLATKLIAQLEDGRQVTNLSMNALMETITPVTAISSNHFHELMQNIGGLRTFKLTNMKLIVYDLGLSGSEATALKSHEFIVYRTFGFHDYPMHVENLSLYAWKLLIIQEVLAERGGVLWMDSSIIIKDNITTILQYMEEHKSGFLYYLPSNGHSIVSATHPKMLTYFPTKIPSDLRFGMPQATGMVMFNTRDIREKVLKWAILCSLDQSCIAPIGSTLKCNSNFPIDRFGGCHRYDQSMMSLLVNNAFNGQRRRYMFRAKHSQRFAVTRKL